MKQYIFAEYSQLFKNDDKKNVLEEIKKLDFESCCKILSVLGSYERHADRDILNNILINLFPEIKNDTTIDFLKKNDIISRHGVLLAWKYLLINNPNYSASYSEKNIKYILKLILIMQEYYLNKDIKDEVSFVMSNSFFNYHDCQINQLARSYYIFVKNKYFKSKNVKITTIKKTFNNKYDISLQKYIYLMHVLVSYINGLDRYRRTSQYYFSENYQINPHNLPGISEDVLPDLINLLNKLSFNYDEGNIWSKKHILKESEMSLFVNKPLIKVNDNCYIPIENKFFEDLIFNSLFYKIKNCYERADHEFINSFGFMFQDYIEWITSNMCKKSKGFYNIIKEFSYSNEQRRSPDVMILHKDKDIGDTVLVIEVKSARALYSINDYFNSKSNDIHRSIQKLITNPLIQSIKSINDIVRKKCNPHISGEKTYYFLSVTMNNIPFNFFDPNRIKDEIYINYSNIRIAGYNSISIEEFELFLQVLMFPESRPFGYYLEEFRMKFQSNCSFKNYIKDFQKAKDIKNINPIHYDPITILGKESGEKAMKYFLKNNYYKYKNNNID